MPRDGSGHSDNAIETGHDIIHGAGKETVRFFCFSNKPRMRQNTLANTCLLEHQSSHVDRADKTAPLPTQEGGAGIPGMNAAAGSSQGIKEGDNVGQGGRGDK